MIGPDFCRTMARRAAWPNQWLRERIEAPAAREALGARRAFFGALPAMAEPLPRATGCRLRGSRAQGAGQVVAACPSAPAPRLGARRRVTRRRLKPSPGPAGFRRTMSSARWSGAPPALCIVRIFNHAPRHRGQMHAMLTAAGVDTGDTDLFLMPQAWRHR